MKVAVIRFANSGHVEVYKTLRLAKDKAREIGCAASESIARGCWTFYENIEDMRASQNWVCSIDFVEIENKV